MPTTGYVCTACNRSFRTLSGFHSHFRQRRDNERCVAIYHEHLASLEALSGSESEDGVLTEDEGPMDIGLQVDSGPHTDGDSEVLDDELDELDIVPVNVDEMDGEFDKPADGEFGIVPMDVDEVFMENSGTMVENGGLMEQRDEGVMESDNGSPEEANLASDHRRRVEHILVDSGDGPKSHTTIRYTDRYQRSRAGSVINSSINHDNQYASTINDTNNPWAPFNSKLDWEIARWAKMRGPGSTAFTELLALDGVSTSGL